MTQTNSQIREDKVAEHQTWIRENLWCKKHIFPNVDITCDECRKLMPLREKCDASFANSLNFIDELLKSQREELVENIKEINEYHTDIGGRNVVFTDDYIRKEDIINYLSPNKENKNNE